MIDTVQVKFSGWNLEDRSFFSEVKHHYIDGESNRQIIRRTNNQYRNQKKKQEIYTPKFWIEGSFYDKRRGYFVLEFSIPKFLNGHSLGVVHEYQFDDLVDKIQRFANQIHVTLPRDRISEGVVTVLAYCKNIDVVSICSTVEALNILSSFNYRPRSDYNFLKFEPRRGGMEIKFYNSSTSLALYEKLPEIATNAVTKQEKEFARKWEQRDKLLSYPDSLGEILRVELTLQNKFAVQQAMQKFYPKKKDYTLREVFNQNISDTLLANEVNKVFNHQLKTVVLLSQYNSPIFESLIKKHTKTDYQEYMIRDAVQKVQKIGLKKYKKKFLRTFSERTWFYRLKRIQEMSNDFDLEALSQHTNKDLVDYVLKQFNVTPKKEKTQLKMFN